MSGQLAEIKTLPRRLLVLTARCYTAKSDRLVYLALQALTTWRVMFYHFLVVLLAHAEHNIVCVRVDNRVFSWKHRSLLYHIPYRSLLLLFTLRVFLASLMLHGVHLRRKPRLRYFYVSVYRAIVAVKDNLNQKMKQKA